MKLVRIFVLAVCAALGAIIGGAGLAQAAPTAGVSLAAPAVLTLEKPVIGAFPVEKTYWRRWHRWHRYHYYHPYYHRWHRYHYYHRHYWHPWRRYYW